MPPPNTSATGGYLAPRESLVDTAAYDLDDKLQEFVVGITGLSGALVRPRWQANDPKQPDRGVNWCAIGVSDDTPDAAAYVRHVSTSDIDDPDAHDEVQRHPVKTILASFYGPNGHAYAELFRDGFSAAQNREAMTLAGMGFVDTDVIRSAGDLVNQGFIARSDVSFRIRLLIIRTYPVLNIRSVSGALVSDQGSVSGEQSDTVPFHVEP